MYVTVNSDAPSFNDETSLDFYNNFIKNGDGIQIAQTRISIKS
jgi:hypothetical protein